MVDDWKKKPRLISIENKTKNLIDKDWEKKSVPSNANAASIDGQFANLFGCTGKIIHQRPNTHTH